MSRVGDALRALLGVSTYQRPPVGPQLSDAAVEEMRQNFAGGNLGPLPTTQTRWYMADLELAQLKADAGDLAMASRLCAAMRRDGTLAGLLSTLTSGLVRLPRRFYGDDALANELQENNGTRSTFDDMFPPAELAALAADGRMLGVGVGELLTVEGRDLPVFYRLEPEYLFYRWSENRWFYRTNFGLLPITPGDGHWILHIPGGRVNPWRSGLWHALGRSYIAKEHAIFHRANYSSNLANPARAAVAPIGASEEQRKGFLSRLIAWGVNTTFELPVGWDVKLIESKGEGYQVFAAEIDQADKEMMISLAGQVVTTTGGTGFANADVHRLIRGDIIQDVGDALAYTLNTQGLPVFTVLRKGPSAIGAGPTVEYDTKAPKDREAEGRTLVQVAAGIEQMREALLPDQMKPEITELTTRFDIPIAKMTPAEVEEAKTLLAPVPPAGESDPKSGDSAKISNDGAGSPTQVE